MTHYRLEVDTKSGRTHIGDTLVTEPERRRIASHLDDDARLTLSVSEGYVIIPVREIREIRVVEIQPI